MKHKCMRLDEFIRLARSMVLKVSQKYRNFETKLSLTFMYICVQILLQKFPKSLFLFLSRKSFPSQKTSAICLLWKLAQDQFVR